jgi:hypothetical protein
VLIESLEPDTAATSRAVTTAAPASLFEISTSILTLDASTLTFNLNNQPVIFNRQPFTKELFLFNKSLTSDIPFVIQVQPPEVFSASPSFGKVGRGESQAITIIFKPDPYHFKRNPDISGFIRVRSLNGFPFER